MNTEEARRLIDSPDWPKIKAQLLAGGDFTPYPAGEVAKWLEAVGKIDEWRKVVDGAKVRELKAAYPGIYPEVLRLAPYFAGRKDPLKTILKLKYPEAYRLCCS